MKHLFQKNRNLGTIPISADRWIV